MKLTMRMRIIEVEFKKESEQPKEVKKLEGQALPDRSVFIGIPKDQVKGVDVGDEVTISVKGEIFGLRKLSSNNPDKEHYEIELSAPKVIEVKSNSADMSLKKLIEQK